MMDTSISEKIKTRQICVGILGLGYVGLPLALEFAKYVKVNGYDIDQKKIDTISKGISPIDDISDNDLLGSVNKSFFPTDKPVQLRDCDVFIITVPTPLYPNKNPNLEYIKSAARTIKEVLKPGSFVILESTTYPGTTEEILIPILESGGYSAGTDFGVAYSPERIDPGNPSFSVKNTPKVVGGINKQCTDIAADIYSIPITNVIKVRDSKTAEAVKMMENIFRNVNIALVNELSLMSEILDINIWEVIQAAATKPYGYMPFYPGPGVGGHCIPLDPFYLSYKAKKINFLSRFIEMSGEINDFMIFHTVYLIEKGLKMYNQPIYGSKISILGLTYKKNIGDTRESPTLKIIDELISLGADIKIFDPHVNNVKTDFGFYICEKDIYDTFLNSDCIVLLVDHDKFKILDFEKIKKMVHYPLLIDCKNFYETIDGFTYIGLGKPMNSMHGGPF